MKDEATRSFFEADVSAQIPEALLTTSALEEYLESKYRIKAMRIDTSTEMLADILSTGQDAAKLMLNYSASEKFKLVTLLSRLSHPLPTAMARSLGLSHEPWHLPVANKRWFKLIVTAYTKQNDEVVNEHASVSNFPDGQSTRPKKREADHRINYFLWSLWEGFPPEEKSQMLHLEYRVGDEGPENSALSSRFVQLLMEAGHLLERCVAHVAGLDPRSGHSLPHLIAQDHVDIVNYHVSQTIFTATQGYDRRESLRAELVKSAALNMALNETDGITAGENDARAHIPAKLEAILALSDEAAYEDGRDSEIRCALARDFDIDKSRIPKELISIALKLADIYAEQRSPVTQDDTPAFSDFVALHTSMQAVGVYAALLTYDYLNRGAISVDRQVNGETGQGLAPYASIKKFFATQRPLPETLWKFYLNRYAALFYGYTKGFPLDVGVASYYEARALRRSVTSTFFRACMDMDSIAIAWILQRLSPDQLLFESPVSMPGARINYRQSVCA